MGGVYLIVRNCFSQSLLLSLVGATTILLGGVVAFLGQDAKKIVALSTLSQLGLIGFTLGIGSEYLTFYHLITHAFFKRLLFMCVGILIHTTYGTQERRTGGDACSNRESILLGSVVCLSISGAPLSTGANSKHGIMDSIRGGYPLLLISLFLGGRCLTILYRGKLLRVMSGYKVGQSRAGRPSLPRVALIPFSYKFVCGPSIYIYTLRHLSVPTSPLAHNSLHNYYRDVCGRCRHSGRHRNKLSPVALPRPYNR